MAPALFPQPLPDSRLHPRQITGAVFTYTVQSGGTPRLLAARFGAPLTTLRDLNQFGPDARLAPGGEVFIDNRHLVPATLPDGIVVNIPQRMLFFFRGGALRGAWPVAIGRLDAPTVTGRFKVVSKRRNPVWTVPDSIKKRWEEEGREIVDRIPPGPNNPLGPYWIGLDRPLYGIHGTNAPRSIYGSVSQGCIRMQVEHVAELFAQVERGMPVHILYQPVVMAVLPDGTLLLEAHPDYYQRHRSLLAAAKSLGDESGLAGKIDWQRVEEAVTHPSGTPVDVTLRAPAPADLASR